MNLCGHLLSRSPNKPRNSTEKKRHHLHPSRISALHVLAKGSRVTAWKMVLGCPPLSSGQLGSHGIWGLRF
jgi:hypothetical protein